MQSNYILGLMNCFSELVCFVFMGWAVCRGIAGKTFHLRFILGCWYLLLCLFCFSFYDDPAIAVVPHFVLGTFFGFLLWVLGRFLRFSADKLFPVNGNSALARRWEMLTASGFWRKVKIVFVIIITAAAILAALIRLGIVWPHQYNFKIGVAGDLTLRQVNVSFYPWGGFADVIPSFQGGMMQNVRRDPVPQEIGVTFVDPEGKKHRLQTQLELPKTFRGDIVAVIDRQGGEYHLRTVAGEFGALDIRQIFGE